MQLVIVSQWVGAVFGVLGTGLLSSKKAKRREYRFVAFVCYIISNVGFMVCALQVKPVIWGILCTQLVFTGFSIQGIWNNRPPATKLGDEIW